MCAHNRSGLLCGTCSPGCSLSLGSAHCIPCSSRWPRTLVAIVIGSILGGITLVAVILILNLTVAVGTINGLISMQTLLPLMAILSFLQQNLISLLSLMRG